MSTNTCIALEHMGDSTASGSEHSGEGGGNCFLRVYAHTCSRQVGISSALCRCFNFFSVFINSLIPTGISSNSLSSPVLPVQFVSLPPPSSSILTAVWLGLSCAATMLPLPSDASLLACIAALAKALCSAHSSISSRYMSHTQFTHPDMQQLSGSVGLGGTRMPAISVEAASISILLSLTPGFEPKTVRALSSVISFCVFGGGSEGVGVGGAAGVASLDASFERVGACEGRFFSISGTCYQCARKQGAHSPTCIVPSDRSSLFSFRRYVVFVTSLYPIAVLQTDSCLTPWACAQGTNVLAQCQWTS